MTARQDDNSLHITITSELGSACKGDYFFHPSDAEPGVVYLQVSGALAQELGGELHEAGARFLKKTSAASAIEVPNYVTVTIALAAGPGVWLSLRTAIRALAERNKHKTFRVELPGGGVINADGQSAADVTRLLNTAQELFERQAQSERESEQHQLNARYAALEQATRQLLPHREGLPFHRSRDWVLDRIDEALSAPPSTRQKGSLIVGLLIISRNALLREALGSATSEETRHALAGVKEAYGDFLKVRFTAPKEWESEGSQWWNEITQPLYAQAEQAARPLLAHRDGLAIDQNLATQFDGLAWLLSDDCPSRGRGFVLGQLKHFLEGVRRLEQDTGTPIATTDGAMRALTSAIDVMESLPLEVLP